MEKTSARKSMRMIISVRLKTKRTRALIYTPKQLIMVKREKKKKPKNHKTALFIRTVPSTAKKLQVLTIYDTSG